MALHWSDNVVDIYTSFHNNKGVVKEVLKEGVGVDTPPKKSKVTGTKKKNEKYTRSFLCCLIPNQICWLPIKYDINIYFQS